MEVLETIESKLDALLQRLHALQAENESLKKELAEEKEKKQDVVKRLDHLLQKIDEIDIP